MPFLFTATAAMLLASSARVALVFSPEHALPPAIELTAVAETAAIWKPYGVLVTRVDAAHPAAIGDQVIAVVLNCAPAPPGAWQAPLGAVDFDGDTPARTMTVYLDRLVRMIESAPLFALPAEQWPRRVHETLVGRALGRVIAHEIGHVLLRSKGHTRRGLMRAVQRVDELTDPGRGRYRLSS